MSRVAKTVSRARFRVTLAQAVCSAYLRRIASYIAGPTSVAAGVQQSSDHLNYKQTVYNADIVYALNEMKIYVGHLHSRDNTGLADTLLAEQPIADTSQLKRAGRIDDGPFTGVAWQVSGPLLLTGAFYYDHIRNVATAGATLGSGTRDTVSALAEYSLSKRTEVYGTVDFNGVTGAATIELPGRSNQTGIALGLRNFF